MLSKCKRCKRVTEVAYDHYENAAPHWVCIDTQGCRGEVARLRAADEAAQMAARSPELAERMAELGYGSFSDIFWMPCGRSALRDGKMNRRHDLARTISKYSTMFGDEVVEAFVCGCPPDDVTERTDRSE